MSYTPKGFPLYFVQFFLTEFQCCSAVFHRQRLLTLHLPRLLDPSPPPVDEAPGRFCSVSCLSGGQATRGNTAAELRRLCADLEAGHTVLVWYAAPHVRLGICVPPAAASFGVVSGAAEAWFGKPPLFSVPSLLRKNNSYSFVFIFIFVFVFIFIFTFMFMFRVGQFSQ